MEDYAITLRRRPESEKVNTKAGVICAFEVMRDSLGRDWSRWLRMPYEWNRMDTQNVREEGLLYSQLVHFFMAHPKKESLAGKQNIADIAKTWKVAIPTPS